MSKESKYVLAITFILLAIGIVMLFSASAIYAGEGKIGDPYYFFKKQLLWFFISICGLILAIKTPYTTLLKIRYPLLIITILALVAVLIPDIGTTIRGTRRWLRFGSIGLQPSEMAKITLIIFFSAFVSLNTHKIKSFSLGFLPSFGLLTLVCGLILLEPDVGTAIFIALVTGLLLIIGGARLTHIVPIFCVAIFCIILILAHKSPYIMDRINVFLNPSADQLGKGYHIQQSLIALGSGGMLGTGLGQSTQKLFFLPEAQSDFIFPIIGEELGFIGTTSIILLFLGLLYVGWRICKNTPDLFAFLLSFGIILFITLQAAINIGVVTGSMPAKGISLPFISYGGSSLFFTMIGIGILVNIANRSNKSLILDSR